MVEYRPLITAAQEAKRWDLVRDLITERRALAQGADQDHRSERCWCRL